MTSTLNGDMPILKGCPLVIKPTGVCETVSAIHFLNKLDIIRRGAAGRHIHFIGNRSASTLYIPLNISNSPKGMGGGACYLSRAVVVYPLFVQHQQVMVHS